MGVIYENLQMKISLLESYKECSKISKQDFKRIIKLSRDKSSYIRMEVACLLGKFRNNASKEILLKLALDRNAWVRMEAYDSLSVFILPEICVFLKRRIIKERNKLACSYAIIAWAEVVQELYGADLQELEFIEELKKKFRIRRSEHCLLECCHAQYILGQKEALKGILNFFTSKDYQVRYAVLHILQEILNNENREIINERFKDAFLRETTMGLKKDMIKFRQRLIVESNIEL